MVMALTLYACQVCLQLLRHQHGPGEREQNENTAISARHGLPRGAGADELAHQ